MLYMTKKKENIIVLFNNNKVKIYQKKTLLKYIKDNNQIYNLKINNKDCIYQIRQQYMGYYYVVKPMWRKKKLIPNNFNGYIYATNKNNELNLFEAPKLSGGWTYQNKQCIGFDTLHSFNYEIWGKNEYKTEIKYKNKTGLLFLTQQKIAEMLENSIKKYWKKKKN